MMGYGEVWMWLLERLTLAGLVLLVMVAVHAFGGGITRTPPAPGSGAVGRSRAREMLDARYANSELGTVEYRARLQALQDD